MRARDMRGFSIVEVAVVITILTVLVSIAITTYHGMVAEARRDLAAIEVQKLARMITERQLSTRVAYDSTSLPPEYRGTGLDPWEHEFKLDLAARQVVSAGPDGVFGPDSATSDDVRAGWEAVTSLAAKLFSEPAVLGQTGTSIEFGWAPVPGLKKLVLRRTGPDGKHETTLDPAATRHRVTGLVPRTLYVFRLEAIDASDHVLVSGETKVFLADSSPPFLAVRRDLSAGLPPGRARFLVEARAQGSELADLAFGERHYPLRGTAQSLAVEQTGDPASQWVVPVVLTDRAGSRVTTEVVVSWP